MPTGNRVRTDALDFAHDGDLDEVLAQERAIDPLVSITLVDEHGPGGGWPTVTLEGPYWRVTRYLRRWGYASDGQDGDDPNGSFADYGITLTPVTLRRVTLPGEPLPG